MNALCHYLFVFVFITIAKGKNVKLTTTIPSSNGATVTMLQDTTITSNEWSFTVVYSRFQMLISLDNTWGFHPNTNSTVRIEMMGSTQLETSTDRDLLTSFSVGSSKYWSSALNTDAKVAGSAWNNQIIPGCDTSTPPTTTGLDNGDIYTIGTAQGGYLSDKIGFDLATTAATELQWKPVNNIIHWPIIYVIQNYPIQDFMYVHYENPTDGYIQSCGFNEAFPINQGLQIYIGGQNPGETFAFSSFKIEYTIGDTEPTVVPTNIPTTQPTVVPSQATDLPTTSPTAKTVSPTNYPTNYPSVQLSRPPTMSPATQINDVAQPTVFPTENNAESPPSDGGIIAAVVVIVLLIMIGVIAGIYFYRKHNQQTKDNIDIALEMNNITTNPTDPTDINGKDVPKQPSR